MLMAPAIAKVDDKKGMPRAWVFLWLMLADEFLFMWGGGGGGG